MTDQLMAPQANAPRRHAKAMSTRKKAWLAGAAAAAALAAATGYNVYQAFAPVKFPQGVHPVAVYTVDDELTTSGANGNHLFGMCDSDSYHITVNGTEQCVVLNGSLGTVPANGTRNGIVLDAGAVRAVQGLVRGDATTRVLLEYDGKPVAVVPAASLTAGGPVTATTLG
jgi:hypothetical protein